MARATHKVMYALGLHRADGTPVTQPLIDAAKELLGVELSNQFEGCTIYEAVGYWHGNEEPSMVFEAFGAYPNVPDLRKAAGKAARITQQQAVMLLVQRIDAELYLEPEYVEAE